MCTYHTSFEAKYGRKALVLKPVKEIEILDHVYT